MIAGEQNVGQTETEMVVGMAGSVDYVEPGLPYVDRGAFPEAKIGAEIGPSAYP